MQTPAVQTALSALDLAQIGRFTDLRDLFTSAQRDVWTAEMLKAAWEKAIGPLGAITAAGAPVNEPIPEGPEFTTSSSRLVKVPVTCEHGGFTLLATVNEAGRLTALRVSPPGAAEPLLPWEPADYVKAGAYEEEEVTLGTGPLAVRGTISVPRGAEMRPGVVLLAGSGPLDRDETIWRNKPLKDIAWGLASRGIAVLRFDKVTYAHAAHFKESSSFTLDDEYMPPALAAIDVLRQHPAVDGERVFVLGHSQGGRVAPRVAAAEPSVAGLIILAGGAQPLHWVLVRQARYLASLNPVTEPAARPGIEALSEKARMVDSPDLSASTPASNLPLSAPASYWLDLRDYNPADLAASLHKPMLILQGGRDYLSTVEDDFARWKAALDGRPEVTIRVYPGRNHLFTSGTGPLSPNEYEPAQHVDRQVVDDIAGWLDAVT